MLDSRKRPGRGPRQPGSLPNHVPNSPWSQSPHLRGLGQWSLTALLSYCQWFWVRDEEVWGSGLEGLWEAASSRGSLQRDPRAKIAQVIFSCLGGGI